MADRMQENRTELAERISRFVPKDGAVDPVEWLRFRRASAPSEPGHSISFPALCVIAQGSKEVQLGEKRYRYDPAHFLIVTAAMPIASLIIEASPERPFLSVLIRLDPVQVGSVMVEAGYPTPRADSSSSAMEVSLLDEHLLDAMLRLVRLQESPRESRFLTPLVTREILHRLLMGQQGNRLRQTAALGGQTHRIAEAIERLRRDFDQPLRIEELARDLG
ncbi:MAG: AraC family transcriptional regulator, partial [Thermomicrobiales bacterium]